MSKTILLSLFLSMVSFALFGQMKPRWTLASEREENYPQRFFFTGYIEGNVHQDETVENAKIRLLKEAQGLLTEGIRVTVKSQATSRTVSTEDRFNAVYAATVQTATEVEIVGINSEAPYYDPGTGIVHAFAYVSRHELTGYYKGNVDMNLTQAEGLMKTAQDLEASGEKAKARTQCEAAIPLLARVRAAQDLLTAIDVNITPEGLQQPRTEALYNRLAQMHAHLAQAVYVYVESVEINFSQSSTIIANRLKADLSKKGCSFTDDPVQADFRVKITAKTRFQGNERGFAVCFADVAVGLFDVRKNKSVFEDEFSQKGIHTSWETAGRKALEDAAPAIAKKISTWIE